MVAKAFMRAALAAAGAAALAAASPASAQISIAEGVHAGELDVPVNKSQVIRADRPYAKALIGAPEIADVLPLSDSSLYVLGKKPGTTSLTLYDRAAEAAHRRRCRITRPAVHVVAEVVHTDGLDDWVVRFAGLAQH